jgi:signal transduction histidine kinase
MQPERSLPEQELIDSLGWLIRMRWFAAALVLLATVVAAHVLHVRVPEFGACLVALAIFGYNILFRIGLRRIEARRPDDAGAHQRFARVQIAFDWIAMAALIHFSGGIESPAIIFFLFHIMIASLLLPHDRALLGFALAPLLVGAIALLEAGGVLRHVSLMAVPRYRDPLYVAQVLVFFTSGSYLTAYVAMTISRRLRRREAELTGLYEGARAATSTLELSAVLDRLSKATTRVLGCKGAAIRLIDPTGRQLVGAASYGVSEAFMSAVLELSRSSIDREALANNKPLFIDAVKDRRIVYPEANRHEGIRTVLVAPLVGKAGPIGVLRAYGAEGHRFDRDDAAFLQAVAAQGAIAIENAQAYESLASADRDTSQFVRTVTHELRSPVQVSQNLLTLLEQGYVGPLTPQQADLVTRARRRIESLQTLVDDLLDLAAGKAPFQSRVERQPLALGPLLREVAGRFSATALSKGLSLRLDAGEDDIRVRGVARDLDRVVNNLVDNAVRYTPRGEVAIELGRESDVARIVVRDSGIGIPASVMPRLFEEFFRAPNAKALEEHGTGLGLAIVKTLVQRHEGTIDVQSIEGQGTTVVVRLPLALDDAPTGVAGVA